MPKNLRILVVNYEYPPIGGGGGVASENLAQALSGIYGHRVLVLTAGVGEHPTTHTDASGVEIIRLPCGKSRPHRSSASFLFMLNFLFRSIIYIFRNRRNFQVDWVHTHFAIPTGPAGVVIAWLLKARHLLTLHGGEIFSQPLELTGYRNPLIKAVVRAVIRHADCVTANSNDTLKATRKFMGIRKPIHVFSLGFKSPSHQMPAVKAARRNGPVKFVMVSRLVPRKDLPLLLDAFSGIDSSRWHLTLAGDGPEEPALKARVAQLGLGSQVAFKGFVSDAQKFEILEDSDVFILPSLHEGLGLVYFEAMYCGLPIITTDNGGQTDFLTPFENALLVPIHDLKALREAIVHALDHPDWRYHCGRRNQEKIRHLSMESVIPHYHSLLMTSP